ncbi:Ig-like domain-containing domain [Echinicola jeungdonensis]|uniref:Ig-like domain-containing protein n=1 Tax=Echinicola jeungdonensis TaxID=709343 RepID=A0ABV5J993_9BACT|nr:Ig-like domain-containing domain [Echinicola jeungdonensis]MDN3669097.1 Ig-like domain-containing domain [Echinicola jeungdonensis]
MKIKFPQIILALLLGAAWISCARQSSPTGGPQDEEPPQLLNSNPASQSLNSKPDKIEMQFNEFIKAENPNRNIIITPRIDRDKMEVLAIKNRLNIKLNQELEDSTTYVFNFQKSIQDITENNPAQNLKLVFSTGNEIDSLKFSGKVKYVFPPKNKEIKDVLVGLYRIEDDTMDVFTDPPYYLSQADSTGKFEITNIKAGTYLAYAWHDSNNTLKADYKSEQYGFIKDSIPINQNISDVHINLFRGDLSELKINRANSIGSNFDVVLSKTPAELHVEHPAINDSLFYRIDEKNIRFYHNSLRNDSTLVHLKVRDSVGNNIDTTFYAVFDSSERKPEDLELKLKSNKGFLKTIEADIIANKPIHKIHYDSLMVRYDTASSIPLNQKHFYFPDSTKRTHLKFSLRLPDSLDYTNFTLFAADSSFEDIEGSFSSKEIKNNYKRFKNEELADAVAGEIQTNELPIIVQLLDKQGEIIKESYLTENSKFRFRNIQAGEYQIRAIIDKNLNHRWDPGNLYLGKQPEPVYHFTNPETNSRNVVLRGGWTNEGIIIQPNRPSGLVNAPTEKDSIPL